MQLQPLQRRLHLRPRYCHAAAAKALRDANKFAAAARARVFDPRAHLVDAFAKQAKYLEGRFNNWKVKKTKALVVKAKALKD
ncbi:hypothetical protein AGMMS49921_07440 [Endomicrobiia bacterium]|nr:hypothetical protein AGMMS49921_07210 [Endomicrobiia bacterium]GHT42390.1 hypothetical protein AGMMS49921_07440 [Endomicrobiia bacterium]